MQDKVHACGSDRELADKPFPQASSSVKLFQSATSFARSRLRLGMYGITFRAGDRDEWDRVAVFADSDFAASYESRRSTTGVIVAYNGSPIMWSTKLQSCASMANEVVSLLPAQSTGEAELNALQSGTREAVGMCALQLFLNDYVADGEPSWRGPTSLALLVRPSCDRARRGGSQLILKLKTVNTQQM